MDAQGMNFESEIAKITDPIVPYLIYNFKDYFK